MQRTVGVHLELTLFGPTDMVFGITPAVPATVSETLAFVHDGTDVAAEQVPDRDGTRWHRLQADAGTLVVDYSGLIEGSSPPAPVTEIELVEFTRPSRYCESDALAPTARGEFGGLRGRPLVDAVVQWVSERLTYVPGSSLPTDGASRTLLGRQGVCRDYAHLTIALLRAMDLPARMVAVYAPGLSPMDFHAVVEVYVEGAWHVVDATHLAPRQSLVRISTGRDAADTAFLTNHWTDLRLDAITVTAVVDEFELDDGRDLIQLT
ncbi:transglutaminase family protein [Galbitalea sp. SE-J8]|uniref:transglutaminase-like domain-containing protein n=1 Tax=Galbitalea sp. SE-J8 TaxID=3054952 RepID=UPI00259D30FA|nr:transglutaminase family protein [Galbitalea sp. SE-J8]MDM4763434.1 transglutaminase family protein [Galbitalea sp. SE-J8]